MSEDQNNNTEVEDKKELDPFTRMMFGAPIKREEPEKKADTPTKNKLNEDYSALIQQVDSIMDSVNKLKPMLKEFSPILDYFKKKR